MVCFIAGCRGRGGGAFWLVRCVSNEVVVDYPIQLIDLPLLSFAAGNRRCSLIHCTAPSKESDDVLPISPIFLLGISSQTIRNLDFSSRIYGLRVFTIEMQRTSTIMVYEAVYRTLRVSQSQRSTCIWKCDHWWPLLFVPSKR
jgi:hypothetical protein